MHAEGMCRTAPATPGLLIIHNFILEIVFSFLYCSLSVFQIYCVEGVSVGETKGCDKLSNPHKQHNLRFIDHSILMYGGSNET